MEVPDVAVLVVIVLAMLGWGIAWFALGRWRALRGRHDALDAKKRAQSTRYGQITEQFAPWMSRWPFASREGFRFLGKPIDGVQFDGDAVYFIEIKSADANLAASQRQVRDAVLGGRVGWVEFYVSEDREPKIIRPWERA